MRLEHVNVKVFARKTADLDGAIHAFHRWIQNGAVEELLIDVADYRHVWNGPGVLLIGHEADYSLDERGGRLGLLYNRKAPLHVDAEQAVGQALHAALRAAAKLEAEPELRGLEFDAGQFEVTVNDRALAPNTPEAFEALRDAVERVAAQVYGPGMVTLRRAGEARERLRVEVSAARPVRPAEVLALARV